MVLVLGMVLVGAAGGVCWACWTVMQNRMRGRRWYISKLLTNTYVVLDLGQALYSSLMVIATVEWNAFALRICGMPTRDSDSESRLASSCNRVRRFS